MSTMKNLSTGVRVAITTLALASSMTALSGTGVLLAPGRAHAVVGRPATPASYAGMARRTSRRTTRRTVARTTGAVTTLPAGCVAAGAVYTCGAVRYQQSFDGGNVVYVEIDD